MLVPWLERRRMVSGRPNHPSGTSRSRFALSERPRFAARNSYPKKPTHPEKERPFGGEWLCSRERDFSVEEEKRRDLSRKSRKTVNPSEAFERIARFSHFSDARDSIGTGGGIRSWQKLKQFGKGLNLGLFETRAAIEQSGPTRFASPFEVTRMAIPKVQNFVGTFPHGSFHGTEDFRIRFFASQFGGNENLIKQRTYPQVIERCASVNRCWRERPIRSLGL